MASLCRRQLSGRLLVQWPITSAKDLIYDDGKQLCDGKGNAAYHCGGPRVVVRLWDSSGITDRVLKSQTEQTNAGASKDGVACFGESHDERACRVVAARIVSGTDAFSIAAFADNRDAGCASGVQHGRGCCEPSRFPGRAGVSAVTAWISNNTRATSFGVIGRENKEFICVYCRGGRWTPKNLFSWPSWTSLFGFVFEMRLLSRIDVAKVTLASVISPKKNDLARFAIFRTV